MIAPMNITRSKFLPAILALFFIRLACSADALAQGWPGYAHDAQHSCIGSVPSQTPQLIRWSVPVDLQPQYSGDDLFIHYGSPVITAANTLVLPVKTGANDGFRVEARNAVDGTLLWSLVTDYSVPSHNWFPVCGVTLTPNDATVAVPAAGGTILVRTLPNSASDATVTRKAFFGIANYDSNPAAYDAAIKICTPISSDAAGNLYFGYISSFAGIPSGLARIASDGTGSFTSVADICGDNSMVKVCHNCCPAFSTDGTKLYVAVTTGGFGNGYLCVLNSATLARQNSARLLDPKTGKNAFVIDDSSATPTVGPDGDVYFGVLENDFLSNNDRGWLLHFSGDLATTKLPGPFGWDDTASIVPASAVPSYAGPSSYLLLTKYNNYAGIDTGDGVNRLALVDPNTPSTDSVTGATVMNPFLTVKGLTPDPEYVSLGYLNAVREWCINSAAIDPINHCAVVNSEDGHLYRWDFTKATDTPGQLSPMLYLAPPTGEAYTPTVIGPDGAVYAINNATLFSVVSVPMLQPVIDRRNNALVFGYPRNSPTATYSVETTIDLENWTVNGVDQGTGVVGQEVITSVPIGPETKRFVRLRITPP